VTPLAAGWLVAFLSTVCVELFVAVPLLAATGAPPARRAGVVVLANLATHPLVWFLFPEWVRLGSGRLVAAELFALSVEGAAYLLVWPRLRFPRAFATSALANGASLAVGISLRALGVGL